MGDFYSTITGIHYSSKEQREAMEKKYMADLENKKIEEQKKANKLQQQQIQMQQNLEQERLKQQQELIESQRQAMLEAEEYRQQEEKKRQIMQNVYNEMQRKKELCDKEGIVYSDVVSFANKLIKPDKKMQTKLEEEKNKYEDLLNKAKEKEMFKDALKIIDEEKHKLGSAPNEKKYKGSSIFFAVSTMVMTILLVPTFKFWSLIVILSFELSLVAFKSNTSISFPTVKLYSYVLLSNSIFNISEVIELNNTSFFSFIKLHGIILLSSSSLSNLILLIVTLELSFRFLLVNEIVEIVSPFFNGLVASKDTLLLLIVNVTPLSPLIELIDILSDKE